LLCVCLFLPVSTKSYQPKPIEIQLIFSFSFVCNQRDTTCIFKRTYTFETSKTISRNTVQRSAGRGQIIDLDNPIGVVRDARQQKRSWLTITYQRVQHGSRTRDPTSIAIVILVDRSNDRRVVFVTRANLHRNKHRPTGEEQRSR